MFQRFSTLTIGEAQTIFDTIFDSEISQENPGVDYDTAFGQWVMQELARDERLSKGVAA